MNKVVHEIHDNSKAAADSGKQILEQLAVMQEELLHLSEAVKSLLPKDKKIPVSVEADLAAQKAGLKSLFGRDNKSKKSDSDVPLEEQINPQRPSGKTIFVPGKGYIPVDSKE